MADAPEAPEPSQEELDLFNTQTKLAEQQLYGAQYGNRMLQSMYPFLLEDMGYKVVRYPGYWNDMAEYNRLRLASTQLDPSDPRYDQVQEEMRSLEIKLNEGTMIRPMTPQEQYKAMDPLEQQRTKLGFMLGNQAMAATGEDYVDPGLERDIAEQQKQMEEQMAQMGITPGSTGWNQMQTEFNTNADVAREQARQQNLANMTGLYQSMIGTNANITGGETAQLMQGIALPGGAGAYGGGGGLSNPYAEQRAYDYNTAMQEWEAGQQGISNLSAGMMGVGGGLLGAGAATGAAFGPAAPIGWGLIGLGALTGFL